MRARPDLEAQRSAERAVAAFATATSLEAESIVANAFCGALSRHLDCSRQEVEDAFIHYSTNLWPLLGSPAGWTTLAILMTNGNPDLNPLAISVH